MSQLTGALAERSEGLLYGEFVNGLEEHRHHCEEIRGGHRGSFTDHKNYRTSTLQPLLVGWRLPRGSK